MALNSKVKYIYDTLKNGGGNVGSEQEFNDWFFAKGKEGYHNRKYVYETLTKGGGDAGKSYEEFRDWLGLHAVKPQAQVKPQQPSATQQPQVRKAQAKPQNATPMTAEERERMMTGVDALKQRAANTVESGVKRVKNIDTYRKNKQKSQYGNVQLGYERPSDVGKTPEEIREETPNTYGDNQNVVRGEDQFDAETGEFKPSYVTSFGNAYENKAEANQEQDAIDEAMRTDEERMQANRQQVNGLADDIDNYMQQVKDESGRGALSMGAYYGQAGYSMMENPEWMAAASARTAIQNARNIIAEADHNAQNGTFGKWWESSFAGGAARGFGQKLFDVHTWDMGLSDTSESRRLLDALNKADKGQPLTKGEQMLLDAKAVELATQAYFGSAVGHGYKAGQVTAEALPFMLEMYINPASAAGRSAQSMLTRYALKKFGKSAIKKGGEKWLKGQMLRKGGRVLGDIGGAMAMSGTTGAARTMADATQRHIGDLKFDAAKGGQVRYGGHENGQDWGEAIAKAYAGTTIENYSEMVGAYLDLLPGLGAKLATKGLDKIGLSKVNDFIRKVKATDIAKAVDDFAKKTQWHGVFGEYAEEVVGNVMNALLVGDSNFDVIDDEGNLSFHEEGSVLNLDDNLETFLGVSLMGGFMSGVKTLGYRTPKYQARKDMERANRQCLQAFNGNRDLWGQFAPVLATGSDEDIKGLLHKVLTDEVEVTPEQKMAMLNYVKESQKYKGVLQAENKRRTDDDANETLTDLETSFDNGYNLQTAKEQHDAKNMRDYTRQQLEELVSEDMMRQFDEDPMTALYIIHDNEQWTDEDKQKALDYVNAKATYDGMIQSVRDRIETETQQATEEIDSRVASEEQGGDGKIHPATMKADNRQVYIVSGNVRMLDDGSMVDRENSDKDLIVRDAETGKVEFVSIDDILRTDEVEDAEQLKQEAVQNIQETVATEASNAIDGVLSFEPNSNFTIMSDDGAEHTVQVVQDQGDGTVAVLIDGATDAVPMVKEQLQEMSEAYNMSRLQQYEAEKAVERAEEAQEQSETAEGAEEVAEGAEGTPAQETPTEEEEPMPMIGEGEDAEPDFASVTPERAHKYVYEESGLDEQTADEFVGNNLKAAQKELDKAKSKTPKMGTSISQYNKAKQEYDANVNAAQQRVDYWNQLKSEHDNTIAQRNAERAAERKAIEEREKAKAEAEEAARQAEITARQEEEQARGANTVGEQVKQKWNDAPKVEGSETEITLQNGERVKGRYMLVESGAATASHDARNGFARSEGFPVDESGQTVNDRDYERDKDAQNVTRSMGEAYDSRAIQDVPVVSRDGVVLSGNGRTMAGEIAAQNGTDGAYTEHLRNYGSQYGFTQEQVDGMQHPRLVFVPEGDMPYTTETFAKFNEQAMKSQSKTEKAVKMGKVVDDATYNNLVSMVSGFDSLSDFYNSPKGGAQAVNALQQAGVVNEKQMAELYDGEKLSEAGRALLESVLIGKAFEGNADMVRMLSEFPSLRRSVVQALTEIGRNKQLGNDYNVADELAEAVKLAYNARKQGYTQGQSVSAFARQLNLFPFDEGSETVADYTNATILMLADALNDNRETLLRNSLALYNDAANDAAAGQLDIFGGGVRSKETIIKDVLNFLNNGERKEQQAALNDVAERRKANATSGAGSTEENGTDGASDEAGAVNEGAAEVQQSTDQKVTLSEHYDGEVTSETTTDRYGNTKTTFAQYRKTKSGQIKRVTKGGAEITADDIDFKAESEEFVEELTNSEKPIIVLEIRRSKDGAAATIRHDGVEYDVRMKPEAAERIIKQTEQANSVGAEVANVQENEQENAEENENTQKKADNNQKRDPRYREGWDGDYDKWKARRDYFDEIERKEKAAAEQGRKAYYIPSTDGYGQRNGTFHKVWLKPEEVVTENGESRYAGRNLWTQQEAYHSEEGFQLGNIYYTGEEFAEANGLKKHTEESNATAPETKASYSIEPTTYTNKKGKTTPMHLVTFGRELSKEEIRAGKELAKESRGWYDREKGGFMMRSEESAKELAETISKGGEAVADAQPLSLQDMASATQSEEVAVPQQQTEQPKATEKEDISVEEFVQREVDAMGKHFAKDKAVKKALEKGVDDSNFYDIMYDRIQEYIYGNYSDLKDANKLAIIKDFAGVTTRSKEENTQRKNALIQKIMDKTREYASEKKEEKQKSQPANKENVTANEQPQQEEKKPKSKWVDDEDAERFEQLKAKLRQKMRGQMNMGVDPEIFALGTQMAFMIVKHGARKFADYARAMIDEMGDDIRKQLKTFYNGARDMMEDSDNKAENKIAAEMDDYDTVRKFDVANFDKPATDVFATAEQVVNEQEAEKEAEIAKEKIAKERNDGRKAQENGKALDGTPLRPLTAEDLEDERPEVYHQGKRVYIMMVVHSGEQVSATQFSKPTIDGIYLTNGNRVKLEDLMVADRGEEKNQQNTSENEEKNVSLQQEQQQLDLFGNPVQETKSGKKAAVKNNVEQQKNKEDGLRRNDELRTEGLPADQTDRKGNVGELGEEARKEGNRTDGAGEAGSVGRPRQSVLDELRSSDKLEEEKLPSQKKNTGNNHAERGKDYAPKGVDARIEANIAAIELMQKLIASGKKATARDMQILRKFSGWGGLGKAFENDSPYSFNPTAKKLKELLGADGYQQAVDSRHSAYYTPANVIDALWDIARAMGFKGGKVLEGSAGIGNILGLMPRDMSERSDIQAVEIDETTGNILSLLYPDAKVEIQGFEQTKVRNGSVDLAITNVPFITDWRVMDESGDKDLSAKFHNIHDFCIAKNVRKLREGGIGIFITSNGTLDNSQALRNWLVSEGNADVVGAFRLNNETFGGTGTTSDIIVIRKRVNGKKSPNAIDVSRVTGVRTADYVDRTTMKTKTASLEYNEYFVEHPEKMGGEMAIACEKGDNYRPTSKGLYPKKGIDQKQRLTEFVEEMQSKDWESDKSQSKETDENTEVYEELGEGVKEGSMLIDKEGRLCVASYGQAVPLPDNGKKIKGHTKQECFNAYIAIKDAVAAVLDYQTKNEGNEGLQPLLNNLNKAYDDFVKTYGHLNKNTAITILKNDMEYSSIAALERYEEYNDEQGKRNVRYSKSDIFKKRVVEKESEPKPQDVKDGVITSIYMHGRIDVPYISEQLGMSEEEVKSEIIKSGLGFENPLSREMEVSYEYLSGNVREKLRQAEEANENGEYDANIKALKKVIPMDIPAHLVEFTLGSSWLDAKLYEEYIKARTDVEMTVKNIGGTWVTNDPWSYRTEKNRAMAVESRKCDKTIWGHELIAAALQNKTITVSKTETDPVTKQKTTITDKEATQMCASKIDEIRQDFKDWARDKMQNDAELAKTIGETYNERFNNYVPKTIGNEFVPEFFSGANHAIHLEPHQAKAAIRATTQPVLFAHEVGAGKTFTLITSAMEMRRLGTARKPMIVVQNATLGQFVESAKFLYPNAKVLALEESDRNKEGRKAFYAKIKYNDWDLIVIPQSAFEMIPDSEERQIAFVKAKIAEKMYVLEQLRNADVNPNDVKRAERELEKLEEELATVTMDAKTKRDEKREAKTKHNAEIKAKEMLDRKVDDVENFDDMGVDAILIDEAHEYKHLGFSTAMQRGVKGIDPSYSKKSQGVYLKCQSVKERTGGRNVVFATGTPISNTAAEIWTFMRYLMPEDVMKEYGIYYFDDFVRNFGNLSQMLEFQASGKFKENNRFAGYVNLPELVRIWSSVADTVTSREIESKREARGDESKIPEMEGGKAQDIYLPQTRALRSVMKFVKARLEEYDKMSGREKKENSHIPLTMYGLAKAAAVDPRLVLDEAEDEPNSKTNEAVRQTLKSLEDSKDYKGTVAIFSDIYQNKQSGFNLYEDIRNKLIAQGVPAEQIVIIKSGMSVNKKLEIFEKVNAGEIRVIMGSTFTLGTGVNIQERLHTLIHMDAPVRPMDYTQRNGRILRQGNLHKKWGKPVRVLRFGVEDSLDVTAYQRLKTKGAIADSIMQGKKFLENSMENRTMEEDEDVFGDTVAQLSGSEYALLKQQAEREVRKLEAKKKQHEFDQTYVYNRIPQLEGQIKASRENIADNEKALAKLQSQMSNKSFEINGKKYGSVDAMADFIKEYNKKINDESERIRKSYMDEQVKRELSVKVGGFDFNIRTILTKSNEYKNGTLITVVKRAMTYSCDELGLKDVPVKQGLLKNALTDIVENVLTGNDFRERIEASKNFIASAEEQLEQLRQRKGKPFEQEQELTAAQARLEEYTEKMVEELAAKEAKYAEVDAEVQEANVTNTDIEDDEGSEMFRDEEENNNEQVEEDENTMQREGDGRVLSMSQDKNYSRKQRWELMQREWKRMQNKAKEYIDILKLDRIAVYGTVEDMPEGMRSSLSERKKKAKGWYDTKTGKIVIILGNHRNAEDVAKTILHEAVAHYGLRRLFGKNFDTFLDNVYQNADVDVKMRIADMAARQRAKDSAANRARRTTEDYLRIGTEEYLAKLAEDMDFENRRESFWSKIKSLFIQMLESIGLKDYEAGELSDNELRYILWRSYKNLSSPGEYRNVFDVAEDVVMQENLGVGNFTRGEMPESMLLPSEKEGRKRVAEQGMVGEYSNDTEGTIDEFKKHIKDGKEKRTRGERDQPRRNAQVEHEAEQLVGRSNQGRQVKSSERVGREISLVEDDELFRDAEERDRVTARDMYERMVSSGRYQFQEAVQDSMLGLKALYKAVLGKNTNMEDVPGNENAYMAENLMSSATAAEQSEYFIRYMKPLIETIHKLCGSNKKAREELTNYLMAKHGLERNRILAERDFKDYQTKHPTGTKTLADFRERDYAGLTALTEYINVSDAEAEAQRMVDAYEQAHDVTELWQNIKAANEATLTKLWLSGVLSRERYEQIRDMFEYYIPLQGFEEKTSDEVYGYLTSKNGPLMGSPIKRAKGRSSKADDPIATMGLMADKAIQQGNRNRMKICFLNFVLNHPSDLVSVNRLWLKYDDVTDEWVPMFADISPEDTAEEVEQKVEQFEQKMQALAQADPDHYKHGKEAQNIPYRVVSGNLREHQVLVKRAGETYVLTINGNPRAAQALNGLTNPDVEQNGVIGKLLGGAEYINRQLSAFYTTRNPDFVASNFLRDMIYSNCMSWAKEGANYGIRFNKNFAIYNPVRMARLYRKWENGTLNMGNKTESLFYEFMKNGGETGYTNVRDLEAHKRSIAQELKRQGNTLRAQWHALGELFDLVNRSVENTARFAAFVTSKELGRTTSRAVYDAKEISVNFNKKGSGSKMLGAQGQTLLGNIGAYISGIGRLVYVFWNAGVQGTTNLGKAIKRRPKSTLAGLASMFVLGYIVPTAAAILAGGGGDDDDDDKNDTDYWDLPEYVRRSNICFKVSKDNWIKIPLPIEFRAMYGLGEITAGTILGRERYSNSELAFHLGSQVSQVLPLDVLEGGGGLHPFIPSVIKPLAETAGNRSWTGMPIYRDSPFNENDPEWTKAYSNTNKTLVSAAEWLNEISGGDKYKKGAIDINPAQVEYMLNGYFGGVSSTINKLANTGEMMIGERDFDWRNVPIANRVLTRGDERTEQRKIRNDYFKYKERCEETKRLLKKYEAEADNGVFEYAERLNFLNNSKDYGLYEIYDEIQPDINSIRKEMKDATDEERKELEKEERALQKEMVLKMRALEDAK